MSFDFTNDTPIYLQIIDDIKIKIISKEYSPSDKIPSVRELSMMYQVNPNTIQKALSELEDIGLIITERTNGKFVTSNTKIIEQITEQTIDEMVDKFIDSMKSIGIDKKQIISILKSKEIKWKY